MLQRQSVSHVSDNQERKTSGGLSDAECVDLLQSMLRHDTTAQQGREAAFVDKLAHFLNCHGIVSNIIVGDAGRSNLVATLDSGRDGHHLVFCGHCDTVPLGDREWSRPPFSAMIENGRIHGRGSADMKGGLAALVASLLDLHADDNWSGRLSLAVTYGEETGSEGARLMAGDGSLAPFDAMIIAEPTSNRVVHTHKGALWLSVTANGRTSHGSMPQMGLNALEMLVSFRQAIDKLDLFRASHRHLGGPTICLTSLHGGTQINVVPDYATAEFDIRTLPGQNHADVIEAVGAVARTVEESFSGGRIAVSIINSLPALETGLHAPVIEAAMTVRDELGLPAQDASGASYFTDGSVLQSPGSDIVILGPGDPAQAHQTDESLDLVAFHDARRLYTGIARQFLCLTNNLGGQQ